MRDVLTSNPLLLICNCPGASAIHSSAQQFRDCWCSTHPGKFVWEFGKPECVPEHARIQRNNQSSFLSCHEKFHNWWYNMMILTVWLSAPFSGFLRYNIHGHNGTAVKSWPRENELILAIPAGHCWVEQRRRAYLAQHLIVLDWSYYTSRSVSCIVACSLGHLACSSSNICAICVGLLQFDPSVVSSSVQLCARSPVPGVRWTADSLLVQTPC